MRALLVGILLLASAAEAQTPLGLPAGLTLPGLTPEVDDAERRWLTDDVVSKRFPDDETAGATFLAGTEVIVIVEDGGRVRVHKGDQYGWVPASKLTTEAPAAPSTPPSSSLLPPGMQLTPGGGPPPLLPPPGAGAGGD